MLYTVVGKVFALWTVEQGDCGMVAQLYALHDDVLKTDEGSFATQLDAPMRSKCWKILVCIWIEIFLTFAKYNNLLAVFLHLCQNVYCVFVYFLPNCCTVLLRFLLTHFKLAFMIMGIQRSVSKPVNQQQGAESTAWAVGLLRFFFNPRWVL
jgi:hypothetical protein